MIQTPLLEDLRERAARGATIVELDDEVLASARGLSDDERAAAWLFAWQCTDDPRHAPSGEAAPALPGGAG